MREPPRTDVTVDGGELATYRLGSANPEAPTVLAIHGITSNSRAWLAVAAALGDAVALQAVDLRGRAASGGLPGPYGIGAHVRDMVAVLDALELEPAIVIGHSLGAYIASALGAAHPGRVRGLVLVDGGLTIPSSQDVDPDAFMEAFLGPTLARLRMIFPDREAYHAWWSQHPAIVTGDIDPALLMAYADHDLTGTEPNLRSGVDPESVRADGADVLSSVDAHRLALPATLLCAERGMIDDPKPMQPLPLVRAWAAEDPDRRRAVAVAGVNHYTITLGARGAAAVARELRASAAPAAAPPGPI